MQTQGHCTICGRPLARGGHKIGPIGEVGPECYRKIERWVVSQGLLEVISNGLWVPRDAPEEDLRKANEVIFSLRRSGLIVEVEHHHDGARIAVVGVASLKRLKKEVAR